MNFNRLSRFVREYNKSNWFHLILMGLVISLVYLPSLKNGFVWDDQNFILDSFNQPYSISQIISGDQPTFTTGVYRPVRNMFYPLAYFLWQDNPVGYHLQALLIHLTLSGLVWYLLITIAPKTNWSKNLITLTVLLWSVNPVHVEAVSWLSASMDLISFGFGLGGLILLTKFKPSDNWTYGYLFCLVMLSILANELALGLPVLLAYFVWAKWADKDWQFKLVGLIGVVSWLGYFWIRGQYVDNLSRMPELYSSFLNKGLLSILVIAKYIWNFLIPLNLAPDQLVIPDLPGLLYLNLPNPELMPRLITSPWVWLAVLTHLGLIFSFFWFQNKQPIISLGVIWFYLAIVPVSQILPQPIIFANRYGYFASIGLAIALVGLLDWGFDVIKLSKKLKPVMFIWILIFGLLTWLYLPKWQNDQKLWSYTLTKNPQSAAGYNQLATHNFKQNNLDLAYQFGKKALDLNPNIDFYLKNQINFSLVINNFDEAEKLTQVYLEKFGVTADLETIGDFWYQANKFQKSLEVYQLAFAKYPNQQLLKKIQLLENRVQPKVEL